MGDHALLQPVTVNEFRMFGTTIMSALKTPSTASTACTHTLPGFPNPIPSIPTPTAEQHEQIPPSDSPNLASGAKYCPARTEVTEQTAVPSANTIPLAGVYIPDLPRSRGGWRIALRQWHDIDPKTGHALKDWPDTWFKDLMRAKTAAKRSQRALIACEYEK
jgi:hypothetical protein